MLDRNNWCSFWRYPPNLISQSVTNDQSSVPLYFRSYPENSRESVNRFFGMEWKKHKDLLCYAKELRPDVFANYFKFAIVRNPWDRMLKSSHYWRWNFTAAGRPRSTGLTKRIFCIGSSLQSRPLILSLCGPQAPMLSSQTIYVLEPLQLAIPALSVLI